MIFEEFKKSSIEYWSKILENIWMLQKEGKFDLKGNIILYPTILLLTETEDHFICELLGASSEFNALEVKIHTEKSTYRYLNQFSTAAPTTPLIVIGAGGCELRDLTLAHPFDRKEIESRFPFVKMSMTVLEFDKGDGGIFQFIDGFEFLTLEHCTLINRSGQLFRVKNILYATIISKSATEEKFLVAQTSPDNHVAGVYICLPGNVEKFLVAGQFTSIYLFNKLHETTIGKFLEQHKSILNRALQTGHFISEPHLEWIEKNPKNEDTAINPDLLILRKDGFYDIYDLKTAALDRQSITRGSRARRRFIDYVNEGIAQLNNYSEYFKLKKNVDYALHKYNVKVSNPNLVLVVGNFDNVNTTEVEEACLPYKNITIIDFDTLMQLFINA